MNECKAEDCISRSLAIQRIKQAIKSFEADIEILKKYGIHPTNVTFEGKLINYCTTTLRTMPPVIPENDKPSGKWLGIDYDGYADGQPVIELWECPQCGYEHTGDYTTLTNYCPHCGAKLNEKEQAAGD